MPSQREIRRRIGSVGNIKQITRAMQFVAASKLRRAQDATLASRPYSDKLDEVRALYDDIGNRVKVAPPAKPVEVLGWSGVPKAGDEIQVLRDEQQAREIMLKRQQLQREQKIRRK